MTILRPRPLDWTIGAGRAPAPRPDAWSARIPRPKSVAAHAEEIEKVYEIVMGSRR